LPLDPAPERPTEFLTAPGTKMPPGGTVEWIKTGDGVCLRTARWMDAAAPVRGTVVLVNGRSEFIEKYSEVIGELLSRGYCVFTFDWRGQGLSQRALADPLKGHVRDFAEFDQDLHLIMEQIVLPRAPEPLIGLAHSMGGNVFLRYLHDNPGAFEKAVLTAPMLAVNTGPFPYWVAQRLAQMQTAFGNAENYVFTGGPGTWDGPFEGNVVTSDAGRYARNMALVRENPQLRLASPTFQWLQSAFRSMALVHTEEFAHQIETPVLLISAALDKLVKPGADMQLISRMKRGSFALVKAEHEIMMERDDIRALFWGFFDAFVAAKII
jgi:lysophospholipase